MKKTFLLLSSLAIFGTSCQKDENLLEKTPKGISQNHLTQDQLDPAMSHTFNQHETWSGSITVFGYEGTLAGIPLTLVNGDEIVERGWTKENGSWSVKLNHTPSMDLKVVCEVPTMVSSTPILDSDFDIAIRPHQDQSASMPPLAQSSQKSGQTTVSHRGNNWYDDRTYVLQSGRGSQMLPSMVAPDTISDQFLTNF